jgi:hypothetical protein
MVVVVERESLTEKGNSQPPVDVTATSPHERNPLPQRYPRDDVVLHRPLMLRCKRWAVHCTYFRVRSLKRDDEVEGKGMIELELETAPYYELSHPGQLGIRGTHQSRVQSSTATRDSFEARGSDSNGLARC